MKEEIATYISLLDENYQEIANQLFETIEANLVSTENKIWHRHPVWFIDGNPIVGFDKLKNGLRLMFWSGASFKEEQLKILKKSNFLHIIKKSKKYYLIQQKFHNTINKNFSDYLDKKIYIKYANKQSDVEYNFGSLICRLLNEFPRVSVKNDYYFQVQQAGFELIKFFNKEDNSIKEILENNYQNNGLKSNSFLCFRF